MRRSISDMRAAQTHLHTEIRPQLHVPIDQRLAEEQIFGCQSENFSRNLSLQGGKAIVVKSFR